jgi:DNA ligase-1
VKEFTTLFDKIDQTQSTNEKIRYIKEYFSTCSDADGAWALFFLSGYRIKRLISSGMLREWSTELFSFPSWLIEESYSVVGDTAETISLLLPRKEEHTQNEYSLSEWMEKIIKPLQVKDVEEKKATIISFWRTLNTKEIFIVNKILTGSFRVGVSNLLTLKALSQAIKVPREILSQRLMGNWEPSASFFNELKSNEKSQKYLNPYAFYLAYPFEGDLESLGPLSDWLIEWKWDGIRGQAVVREEGVALWSRGNELVSNQFPELINAYFQWGRFWTVKFWLTQIIVLYPLQIFKKGLDVKMCRNQ